ncbi:S9 family peptidase [Brevundimonas kwangchunensis]|uniref:S9 family peptidase n=1 Tax=Brevundimonas kwangchunensis TaxID=322163 RepID=UPI0031E02946
MIVFEERRARDDLPRYDLQPEGALRYARLYRADIERSAGVRPLLPMDEDAGYTAGPFSPEGGKLIVFRLRALEYRIGVVDMVTGGVVWTDLSPETGAWGRSVEWLSEDAFVMLGMPDGVLPPRLADTNRTQRELPRLWDQAARGEATFVAVGLGPEPERPLRDLWRVDARTGAATRLARGPFFDFEASPDGRHIALLVDGPLQTLPSPGSATEFRRSRSLRMVDLKSGQTRDPPEAQDISTSVMTWSPASDALLIAAIDGDRPRLLSIDPAGAARDVTPPDVTPAVPLDFHGSPTAEAGWIGHTPVVRGRDRDDEGWFLSGDSGAVKLADLAPDARLVAQGRRGALFVSRGRVIRQSADGPPEDLGALASVVRPDGPLGQRAQASPMKQGSAVVLDQTGRLCRTSADQGPMDCVAGPSGAAVSWSHGVAVARGAEGRAANHLTATRGASFETIWSLNPELDGVDLTPARRIDGPDGAGGWLYAPARQGAHPPPVVVTPYPDRVYSTPPPTMRPEAGNLTLNGQLLVAAGYAVLYPDLPVGPEPADGLADRILAVVDAAANDGLVDGDRIGLWGHSFGAWAVVLSAAQSPRFKAVVALNGSYNLAGSLGRLSSHARLAGENDAAIMGTARWLEAGQVAMRASYWSDPERYRRGSAFEQANQISAAVLLVHGEMDHGTGEAEGMYAALRRLGHPAALLYLIGEDHSLHNPGNARIYYRQLIDWFDRHLAMTEPPIATSIAGSRPPSGPG